MTSHQRLVAVAGMLAFAFLGAIQGLYGPLLPGLRRSFALDTSAVGLLFTAHGIGALLGVLVPSLIRSRKLPVPWLSIAGALLMLGAAAFSLAPTWPAALASIFVLALGFGIYVVRFNALFVVSFGARGMTMSQLLNAAFMTGAIAGPFIVGLLGQPSKTVLGWIAALAVALLALSVATDLSVRAIAAAMSPHEQVTPAASVRAVGSRRLLAAFVTLMALYVGVENSIAGWTATLALAEGYSFSGAANLTALFFAAILLGRLLAAGFGDRVRAAGLVIAGLSCIVFLLAIASGTRVGPIALVVTGFALAPIFSATLVWLGSALPTSTHATALVIAGALLGSAVFPPLVGRVVDRFGAGAGPPAILCIAVASLIVATAIYLTRRR